MAKIRLFDVLEERGHKQRWLLEQLRKGGHQFSETYLSQVKSGAKSPSRRFIEAVSDALNMPILVTMPALLAPDFWEKIRTNRLGK